MICLLDQTPNKEYFPFFHLELTLLFSFEILFQLVDNPDMDESPWIKCDVAGIKGIEMMIDSGSAVNTLSESDWVELLSEFIEGRLELENLQWGNGTRRITAYASTAPLQVEATFDAKITVNDAASSKITAKFFVIRGARKSLLGRASAVKLGVLKMGLEINECELTLQETETEIFPFVPDELVHFDIDPTVVPTKNAYINVPAAYRKGSRGRIRKMQLQGIIERVFHAPRWISGMSAVPKGKDDFRLVVAMVGPNKAIRRPFYRLLTIDDMRTMLVGAKWFTKLDIKSAFHHLVLDEESRELTTFLTEDGMFRFVRLVFGVNCAPEIFQRMINQKLEGIPGVITYIDDILVHAESLDELRQRTNLVLAALRRNNLTLNEEKCEFEVSETKFLGHQLNADGFAISEDKVRDVLKFKHPTNTTNLRSFLGLVSYLSDYIPRYADLVKPMRQAMGTEPFEWTPAANEAFARTKEAIASCTLRLGFFDENCETVLYTDASPYALGAVLVQIDGNGKARPISFASKVLTKTESAYAQIQKEALGIIWGVERFYYYLLGRRFTIRTDARGLAFIFGREKVTCKRALNRAEGWALRLSAYDYKVEWIRGKENIADPSSRLCDDPLRHPGRVELPGEIGALEVNWNEISTSSGVLTVKKIREATAKDREIEEVRRALETHVWPETLKRYHSMKEDLRFLNGVLTKAGAIVIPRSLKNEALMIAHAGHPGQSAMKSIMRERVWWLGVSADVERWVESCKGCTLAAKREPPVPMLRSTLPEAPWDKMAIDFNGPHAACGGRLVIVLVDYYSRFLVAEFVKSTGHVETTSFLDRTFTRFGYPDVIRSDNGPPFNGSEWIDYCDKKGIKPEFSTPAFPQQNGLVERYMQLINKSITIAVALGEVCEENLSQTIAAHNAAVQRTTGVPPDVLMFGRKLRRGLPVIEGQTEVTVDKEALRSKDASEKLKSQHNENRKRRARSPDINIGDGVVVKRTLKAKDQTNFAPTQFTVIGRERGDYQLAGPNGESLKRNVTHVKKIQSSAPDSNMNDASESVVSPTGAGIVENVASKRERRKPAYLSDYIHIVENHKDFLR